MLSRNARKKAAQIISSGFSPLEYVLRNMDREPFYDMDSDQVDQLDVDSIFHDNSDDFPLESGRLTNFFRALIAVATFPPVAAINIAVGATCGAATSIVASIKVGFLASNCMGGSLISIIAGTLVVAAVVSPFLALAYTLGGAFSGLALSARSIKEWTGIPKSESIFGLLFFRKPITSPQVSSNTSSFWNSSNANRKSMGNESASDFDHSYPSAVYGR